MTRQLLKKLERYFNNISSKTEEEQGLLSDIRSNLGYFPITHLHRDDIAAIGNISDPLDIDDSDMERIADKMGSAYQDDGFWGDLEIISKHIIGAE